MPRNAQPCGLSFCYVTAVIAYFLSSTSSTGALLKRCSTYFAASRPSRRHIKWRRVIGQPLAHRTSSLPQRHRLKQSAAINAIGLRNLFRNLLPFTSTRIAQTLMGVERRKPIAASHAHLLHSGLVVQEVLINHRTISIPQGSFVNCALQAEKIGYQYISYIDFVAICSHFFPQGLDNFYISVFLVGHPNTAVADLLHDLLVVFDQFLFGGADDEVLIVHQFMVIKFAELLHLKIKLVRLDLVKQAIDTGPIRRFTLMWCLVLCINKEAGETVGYRFVNTLLPIRGNSRFEQGLRIPSNPRFPDISVGE